MQWEDAARKTVHDLGFGEHQFLVVAHDDREHFHVHVLVNRIHPETYKAHYPPFSKRELDKSLREIEHTQGWQHSPGLYRWDEQLGLAVKNSREEMQAHREGGNPEVGRTAQKLRLWSNYRSCRHSSPQTGQLWRGRAARTKRRYIAVITARRDDGVRAKCWQLKEIGPFPALTGSFGCCANERRAVRTEHWAEPA